MDTAISFPEHIFWDSNPIDYAQFPEHVIFRVTRYGSFHDILKLTKLYSKNIILETMNKNQQFDIGEKRLLSIVI